MQTETINPHPVYKDRLITQEGQILPNFTRKCVEWLIGLTPSLKNFSVYEYGAEVALSWWIKHANTYTGITTNEQVGKLLDCYYKWDQDGYVNHITEENTQYDIIIINGKWRDECIVPELQRIKKGGYIIINNYHQERTDYRPNYWQLTTPLMDKHPIVIFHDEKSNTNNRTSIWQFLK